jgi:ABC-type Na+ efflux pump permease subunit
MTQNDDHHDSGRARDCAQAGGRRIMSRTIIAAIVAAVLLLVIILAGPAACNKIRGQKKQIEVSKGQAGAAIDSGAEAMNTVSAVDQADKATDQAVKEATDEIRKAKPGYSNAAALRAACRLRQYRDSERCAALRGSDPAKPVGAN